MLRRRQGIGRPQVVGNERSTGHDAAGKVVVVHREQNDVAEIEVAGFEDTHDLNSLKALPRKEYAGFADVGEEVKYRSI